MRANGRVGHQALAVSVGAALKAIGPIASHLERNQCCHRCTGHQQTRCVLGKAHQTSRPVHNLPLDIETHMVAAAAIGVHRRSNNFGQKATRIPCAMHPTKEAGMRIAHTIGHELDQCLANIAQGHTLLRHTKAERRFQIVRKRCPNAPFVSRLQMRDGCIDRHLGLALQFIPI